MTTKPTVRDQNTRQPPQQGHHNASRATLNGSSKRYPRRSLVTQTACSRCQVKKSKCDGKRPSCGRCIHNGTSCAYDVPTEGMTRMQNMANQLSLVTKERNSLLDLVHASLPGSNHNLPELLSRLDLGEDARDIVANLRADSLISSHNNCDYPLPTEKDGFNNSSSSTLHSFDRFTSSQSSSVATKSDFGGIPGVSCNYSDKQDTSAYQYLPKQERPPSHGDTRQSMGLVTDFSFRNEVHHPDYLGSSRFSDLIGSNEAFTSDENIRLWQMTSPQSSRGSIDKPMGESLLPPSVNGQYHSPIEDHSSKMPPLGGQIDFSMNYLDAASGYFD